MPTTRWSTPSSMKISVAHICHGCDGVGVRDAAAFWLWNWVQASHWQTTSLMALFMPGQKKLPSVSNCDFVIPWWNWCSWCRTLSLLAGGMMSASPCRTRPSLMVRVSLCCQYGWRGWGTSLMSSGQPVMMRLARAHISGLLTKACWKASLWSGIMQAWWIAYPMEGWVLAGDWIKRVCLVWPFPYLGSNKLWSCIPVGITSCIGAMQTCLLGSFWRWIQVAYGPIQLWRTVHRCKCGNSPLQRQQLTSLSLYVHVSAFSFDEGCAGKGYGFAILQECCTKAYLWGINLYCHGKWWVKITWGWCQWWNSFLDLLKSSIIGVVPCEAGVLLEQLSQRGSQGGQARDEGT